MDPIGRKILRHAIWYLTHEYAVSLQNNGEIWDPPSDICAAIATFDNLLRGWPAFYLGTGEDLT